ncbi:MAG: hypothetical protein ACRDEB_00965 [Chitinophagaceae bacterium]
MIQPLKHITIFPFLFSLAFLHPAVPEKKPDIKNENADPKIQAAILLDVSNSMDGLIEQAKAQLWNMVSVMGRATCDGVAPKIEIALYEYGRSSNNITDGYVKQISPFTSDLDKLSQDLFKLNTNGGDEYCGHVIYTSLNDLSWDASSKNYKVIFIAGNEDFLQGNVLYTKACEEAKKKGVIVNTIYCGDRLQGIKEHWNLAGECGNGSFTNINQDAKIPDIPTPYDTTLIVLNSKLNGTYLYYGAEGEANFARQMRLDAGNARIGSEIAAKRTAVKGNKQLYYNGTWDLVDAVDRDSTFITKVDMKTLPDSLKNKSRAELQKIVDKKNAERGAVQKEIMIINAQRENFIAAERAKAVANNNTATLESEVEKIIKEQAKQFNMVIK